MWRTSASVSHPYTRSLRVTLTSTSASNSKFSHLKNDTGRDRRIWRLCSAMSYDSPARFAAMFTPAASWRYVDDTASIVFSM